MAHTRYQSWIDHCPDDWGIVQLRSLKPQIEYGTNQVSNGHGAGVPVIGISQVLSSRFVLSELPCADVTNQERESLALRAHDVLLVRTNGNPSYIGRSTVIPEGTLDTLTVFASYLIRVRLDQRQMRGAFFNYILQSENGRRQSSALANTSAGNFNLGARALSQFTLPLPTPEEQDAIIKAIDAADDQVIAADEQLRRAERVKKALLQSVFVEGIPGRGRAPQTFRWGMAPDGWGETSIRSIVTEPVGNGTSPDAARQEPPGFPTLNVSSIRNGRCDQTKISYIELPVKAAADFAVEQGDFFVLRGNGNRDFVAIGGLLVEEPQTGLVFSDLLIRLRFDKSKTLPEFMKYLWQSPPFLRRLQSYAVTGSGLWKIGQRSISRQKLAVPPNTGEQKDIAAIFDAQEELLLSLGTQLTAARRVKQSLLQNLLTGKIRLKP